MFAARLIFRRCDSAFLSVRLSPCKSAEAQRPAIDLCVCLLGREMCGGGMAIGECLTQTDISHPRQYPKMANYAAQLVQLVG